MTTTDGFIVACMECHQQLGMAVDTFEQALAEAKIHFSKGNKPHDGHTVTVTATKLIRKKG